MRETIKNKIGIYFRKKRSNLIKKIINKIFIDKKKVNIIDIGGTEIFWETIGLNYIKEKNVKITLINLEKKEVSNSKIFNFVIGNGCSLDFNDNSFDLSFSNSVIEHVGNYDNMIKFAKESKRVAKYFYYQTPNFWFPFEPHSWFPFFQFLPDPIKFLLITKINLGHYKKQNNYLEAIKVVQDAKLIDKKLLLNLFNNDGIIINEKFFFLNKSLIITNSLEENVNIKK